MGVALPHLKEAEDAIVSFGQGCEGEPLMQWRLLEKSIRQMREKTDRGTINLNTNGSLPEKVRRSCVTQDSTAFVSPSTVPIPISSDAITNPKGLRFERSSIL